MRENLIVYSQNIENIEQLIQYYRKNWNEKMS